MMRRSVRLGSDLRIFCGYGPDHGLQGWMIIQAFYNGVTQVVRSTIDAATGVTLMNENEGKAYN